MKFNAKNDKAVRELYEWSLGAIHAPTPHQTAYFLLPLVDAIAAGNIWEYECKMALPEPPKNTIGFLEALADAPAWIISIINAAKKRVKPMLCMVEEMGLWLDVYDERIRKNALRRVENNRFRS